MVDSNGYLGYDYGEIDHLAHKNFTMVIKQSQNCLGFLYWLCV